MCIGGGFYFFKYRTYKPFSGLDASEVREVAVLGFRKSGMTIYLLSEEERADFVKLIKSITVKGAARNWTKPLIGEDPLDFRLVLQDGTRMIVGTYGKDLYIEPLFYGCKTSEVPLLHELNKMHTDWLVEYEPDMER